MRNNEMNRDRGHYFFISKVDWALDYALEIKLMESENDKGGYDTESTFFKIEKVLSRIGIANRTKKILSQSCHIIKERVKGGKPKYYIVHFKERYALDGKEVNLSRTDIRKRNRIASLLEDWGMIEIIYHERVGESTPITTFTILSEEDMASDDGDGEWKTKTLY